ncbi:MAG: hypothetical protein Q7T20_12875, partial [Saprospiraceae bacterium]|nr:hypothetical protein [Saprospiraceae bacterium]
MLNRIQVLVVGRQEEIMQTVLSLINKTPDWEAAGALADEEAIELFQQRRFDLVLIGAGVEPESEAKLRAIFTFQNPLIRIIQHFGGGGGLLFAEIRAALVAQQEGKYA